MLSLDQRKDVAVQTGNEQTITDDPQFDIYVGFLFFLRCVTPTVLSTLNELILKLSKVIIVRL